MCQIQEKTITTGNAPNRHDSFSFDSEAVKLVANATVKKCLNEWLPNDKMTIINQFFVDFF